MSSAAIASYWIAGGVGDRWTVYYNEYDDNNYIRLYMEVTDINIVLVYNVEVKFGIEIYETGSPVVSLETTSTYPIVQGSLSAALPVWHHVAWVENGDDYYIFVDGDQAASTTDTDRTEQGGNPYTAIIYIGNDANAGFANDYDLEIVTDELRISDTARWTTAFTPNSSAYPANAAEVYVGSIMPIQGITFDVGTANTSACTPVVLYWNGSAWTDVGTITDGTNNGTGALEINGTMSFATTESVAKIKAIDNMLLYWYRLSLPGLDDTTTVSYVTVDIPFQPLKDLWDGELRTILSCLQWRNADQVFLDHTVGVFEDHFDSSDTGTYAALTASGKDLTVSTDYLLVASTDRLSGLSVYMVSGQENQDEATMSISYWSGDSWVSVGSVSDGTLEDGTTLAKSGFITWNSPTFGLEFKRQDLSMRRTPPERKVTRVGEGEDRQTTTEYTLSGDPITAKEYKKLKNSINKHPTVNAQYEYSLYWYKIEFSATLTGTPYPQIYYIGGIPAQAELGAYSFPVYHNDAVWLLSEQSQHKNKIIKSLAGTVNVFNGSGSGEYKIGNEEDVVGGSSIKAVIDQKYYTALVLFKENETWAIYGSGDGTTTLKISPNIGCVAPQTIQNCSMVGKDGNELEVIIFQGDKGVYATNGSTVSKISDDIDNVFDSTNASRISDTYYMNSSAFYDSSHKEYHWLWTKQGSTTHDKEYVYDCERGRWYTVDRGSGAYLQCGVDVRETNGKGYAYGFLDSGYMVRLDNGLTFATATTANNRTFTMHMGDMAFEGITIETTLRNVALHMTSATATSNTVAVTHYADTKTTGSVNNNGSAIAALDAGDAGKGVVIKRRSVDIGPNTYHGLKFVITNSDDTIGFEPIYLTLLYDPIRQGVRG
jgi:hypothetical protein